MVGVAPHLCYDHNVGDTDSGGDQLHSLGVHRACSAVDAVGRHYHAARDATHTV